MKRYVIGDIHGAYRALKQCLNRSGFNKEEDLLITLGDIVDGWSEVDKCVDELLTIKNRIDIRGNHDQWFVNWLDYKDTPDLWTRQGGDATLKCYLPILHGSAELTEVGEEYLDKLLEHTEFFKQQHYYYIDDENRLFVHGGCDWKKDIKEQDVKDLMWDRHMYQVALYYYQQNKIHGENSSFKRYKEVFIGHTSTSMNNRFNWRIPAFTEPTQTANLWNLDQGGGWEGKLSIMNIDTKEFWQSDKVSDLYPEENGRRK